MKMRDPSSRWLAGVIFVILALMVISIAVRLLNRPDGSTLLSEDTPEGSVQRYLRAVDAGDLRTAHSYLSTELQESCTYLYLRDSTRWLESTDLGVALEDTVTLDGQVEVRVSITQYYGASPFDRGDYSHTQWFTLEEDGGIWRFTDPPWPTGGCLGLDRSPGLPQPARVEP
jgi:hypothetical protein